MDQHGKQGQQKGTKSEWHQIQSNFKMGPKLDQPKKRDQDKTNQQAQNKTIPRPRLANKTGRKQNQPKKWD